MDEGSQTAAKIIQENAGSWIVVLVMLLLAAYFAVAETSFACVSKIRIKAGADRGNSRAIKALKVLDNFDRAVTTVLIGTNITHLTIASMVTVIVIRTWNAAVSIGTLVTTLVVFFTGEMLPKSIAKRYCEPLALTTAASLLMFMKLFTPVSYVLTKIGQGAARLFGATEEVSVTEEELHNIIEDMVDDGVLGETQSELISSALDFSEITVDSILTARVDMDAIRVDLPPEKVVEYLLAHRHSRYPVYEETIDKVIGTLQMRKYLQAYRKDKNVDLRSLIDAPFFVHYSVGVDDLMREMNEKKISIAMVLDDWGGTYGLVTAEDALEELVGEIWDEEDVVEEDFSRVGDGSFEADADMTLDDIFKEMELELDLDDEEEGFEYKRASEWAFEHFTHIPAEGETFTYKYITITVAKMDNNRIQRLRLTVNPEEQEGGAAE